MNQDRNKLPFRKNTEGYFVDEENNILAQDSGKGYVLFPGGGIEQNEDPAMAMIRETEEETGYSVANIKELGTTHLEWGQDWAKTEKQKIRYQQFKGDEMHFFFGKVKKVDSSRLVHKEEDVWSGNKFMPISKAINIIEQSKPFSSDISEYRNAQLKFLKFVQSKLKNLVSQ